MTIKLELTQAQAELLRNALLILIGTGIGKRAQYDAALLRSRLKSAQDDAFVSGNEDAQLCGCDCGGLDLESFAPDELALIKDIALNSSLANYTSRGRLALAVSEKAARILSREEAEACCCDVCAVPDLVVVLVLSDAAAR